MSGFVPVSTTDGSDYHGKMRDLILDGLALCYLGDLVEGIASLAADEVQRVSTYGDNTAVTTLIGAVVEFYPDFTDEGSLLTNYHPAGASAADDAQGVRVVYGSEVIYAAELNDAAAAADDGVNIGDTRNTAGNGTTGDNITGISGAQVSNASTANDAVTIYGLEQQQGNDWGLTDPNTRVLVTLI